MLHKIRYAMGKRDDNYTLYNEKENLRQHQVVIAEVKKGSLKNSSLGTYCN